MAGIQSAALVIIDVQQGFDDPVWGARNNPRAEANAGRLLAAWRRAGNPVLHVQHCSVLAGSPLAPGQSGVDFKDIVEPRAGEPVVRKSVNSGFIGTDLEARLRALGSPPVVVVGLTTPHCVSTTARMAGNLGFETYVVADATAAFEQVGHDGTRYPAEDVHRFALASLHGEFATVVETDEVLALLDHAAAAG
jgi:nicotinamidase-related amidase